jgi:predicted RNA methylase/GNAT superfamily N-acetyltransferase
MPDDRREHNQHTARLLKTHRTLLSDKVRNLAFYKALEQTVTNGSNVLDIGSGTGIWAITAAKLGAKRVVAIEADEMLSVLIKKIVVEKGLSNRIEVICGTSQNVELAREFDIVVSETIGYLGYDENIVEIMADARRRFLCDGGVLIPETISLHARLGIFQDRETIPSGIDVNLDVFDKLELNRPRVLKRTAEFEPLSPSRCLIKTDLYQEPQTPSLINLTGACRGDELSQVNAILLWVESDLTDTIRLDTRETSSWFPNIYKLGAPVTGCRQIEFSISLSPENSEWSAVFHQGDMAMSRRFSLDSISKSLTPEEPQIFELRPSAASDLAFRRDLFAASRMPPLLTIGWDEDTTRSFLASQFDLRERAYAAQFVNAETSIITENGIPIGCMIVDRVPDAITLVDIEMMPPHQGKGFATSCIKMIQAEAQATKRPILLQVEQGNQRAFRLYQKINFEIIDDESAYFEMVWRPTSEENL